MFLYPIIKFLILRGTQGATLSAILGITLGIMLSDTSNYENVPEGWVLTDIGELLTNRDSERVPLSLGVRSKQENKIYDYYGATGVVDKVDGYLFDERLLLIGEDGANLLSRSKDNAFFAEGKYWVNNHAHILDCPEKEVLDYVAFLINSMSLEDYITGSAQPKLTQLLPFELFSKKFCLNISELGLEIVYKCNVEHSEVKLLLYLCAHELHFTDTP